MTDFYETIDSFYSNGEGDKVEPFLKDTLVAAIENDRPDMVVTVLNEMLGYYREIGQHEKAVEYAKELYRIINNSDAKGTLAYGTTLLNIANAYRAAGLLNESMRYHNEAKDIYNANLEPGDYEYASLYNNMSLLFIAMGDEESATDCLERAISIVGSYPEKYVELATSYVNLASVLLERALRDDAIEYLNRAVELFCRDEKPDYHYAAALTGLGEAYFQKDDYEKSLEYYTAALKEIERGSGKNESYRIMEQNITIVKQKLQSSNISDDGIKGLELCESFYNEYGAKMIHEKFPQYEKSIAVGLVGQGSECYGYDDILSRDHDFGPGFCMWLTDSVYEKIGDKLQVEYDKLPRVYKGIERFKSEGAGKRVGVFKIGEFYKSLYCIETEPKDLAAWLFVGDSELASAVNGKIFRDDCGEFTRIRNEIKAYYPDFVWVKKIISELQYISKYGQYNYERVLKRKDRLTASICLNEFIEHVLSLCFLLNRQYAPYYKWRVRALRDLPRLSELEEYLTKLVEIPVGHEDIPGIIERISEILLTEMKRIGIAKGDDTFLENHTNDVLEMVVQKQLTETGITMDREFVPKNIIVNSEKKAEESNQTDNMELVESIVKLEWEAFDKVKNEGGRAFCQDDYETFSIMRKSQYMAWPRELLESYRNDFENANSLGWNLITEKYARMMKSTCPAKYEELEVNLPIISEEMNKIIESIVSVQVDWMLDFAKEYPKAAGRSRSIRTSEDTEWNTSYETYLRGEISTYSPDTLWLYGRFITELASNNKNLAYIIMENTAHLYGYSDLDSMESKIQ